MKKAACCRFVHATDERVGGTNHVRFEEFVFRSPLPWSTYAAFISSHRLLGLLVALVALSATACTDNSTGITEADIACPQGSTATYANYGAAAMTTWCTSCHNTRRPLLTTQAQVQAARNQIIDEAVFSSAMPEGRSMSNDERKQLGQWLSCGAP